MLQYRMAVAQWPHSVIITSAQWPHSGCTVAVLEHGRYEPPCTVAALEHGRYGPHGRT